jgi:hypothetical protein
MKHELQNCGVDKVYFDFVQNVAPPIARTMASTYVSKKRAFEALNTNYRKTGNLDMSRICNYKTSDDIFITKSWKNEGKSHGLYFVLDWSGSMKERIVEMAVQYYIVALFCKQADIPFSFDLFTSSDKYGSEPNNAFNCLRQQCIANSEMSISQLQNVFYLMICWDIIVHDWGIQHGHGPFSAAFVSSMIRTFRMEGTPLYSSMYATYIAARNFRTAHDLQNVSIIYLTDGQGNPELRSTVTHKTGTHVVDPFSGRRYAISKTMKRVYGNSTYTQDVHLPCLGLNAMIRDAGFKIFNLFIGSEKAGSSVVCTFIGNRDNYRSSTFLREEFKTDAVGGGVMGFRDAGNFNSFIVCPPSIFGKIKASKEVSESESKDFVKKMKASKGLSFVANYVVAEMCKDFTTVKV